MGPFLRAMLLDHPSGEVPIIAKGIKTLYEIEGCF